MKTIVAGTRNFFDVDLIHNTLKKFNITELVCGMCRGVDKIAYDYCKSKNIAIDMYPAKWEEYGKAAGPIRNKEMSDVADCLIAFWDGKSKGTLNMINRMRKLNKPVHIIEV